MKSTELSNSLEVYRVNKFIDFESSIEATHVGEHCRGFSVIADEVKKLANRSFEASKEISDLIKTIQSEMNHIVVSMEDSMEEVQEVIRIVHKTVDSFMIIINETQKCSL